MEQIAVITVAVIEILGITGLITYSMLDFFKGVPNDDSEEYQNRELVRYLESKKNKIPRHDNCVTNKNLNKLKA